MDAPTLPSGARAAVRCALLCCTVLLPGLLCAQLFDLGLKGGLSQDDLRTSYAHEALIGGHAGLFVRVKPPILPGGQGELLLSSIKPSQGLRLRDPARFSERVQRYF